MKIIDIEAIHSEAERNSNGQPCLRSYPSKTYLSRCDMLTAPNLKLWPREFLSRLKFKKKSMADRLGKQHAPSGVASRLLFPVEINDPS